MLKCYKKKKRRREKVDMRGDGCVNSMGRILIQYIYQIITLFTLNILQFFCQLYINKNKVTKSMNSEIKGSNI